MNPTVAARVGLSALWAICSVLGTLGVAEPASAQSPPIGYGDLNSEQVQRMRDSLSGDAIYMISLLKFKEQAAYFDGRETELSGRRAYFLFSSAGHPQRFGGEQVHVAKISTTESLDDFSWDILAIFRFPSRSNFLAMYDDSQYQAALVHKDAGLEQAIIMVSELTMSSTCNGMPPERGPEAVHMGELLRFRGTAQYEPGSQEEVQEGLSGKDADLLYEELITPASVALGFTVPLGYFSIDGVLIGDGREWDEFKLTQFTSRTMYDSWAGNALIQDALVHREAGLHDIYTLIGEPPTTSDLPEISAAQPWRWFTMLSLSPPDLAELFSNWQVMMPVKTIAGSSAPREFERDTISPEDISYEYDGETRTIADYIARAAAAGLMVIHDGKVVLEHYGLGIGPESRFHIWSATKSFTGTLVAMALHEGKISSLDDPASLYAIQFANTAYGETSIRNLLKMSSGIDFFHFGSEPDRNDLYWNVVNLGVGLDEWAAALPRRVPDGTDFNYLATDTHVLSAVLRAVYDMPLAEIVETKLWEPAGFAGDATWAQNEPGPEGHALGHCCLSLRLQEFAHLGQLYLDDLEIDGQQTVPADWIDMVSEPQASYPSTNGLGYSLQFWIPGAFDREFLALGAFDEYLWVDHTRGFAVAQFSTGGAVSTPEFFAAMRALGDALSGVVREPPPLPESLASILGEFLPPVSVALGGLVFSGSQEAYIVSESENSASAVYKLSVERDANGIVTGFGEPLLFFSFPFLDASLEFAPGSDVLFFTFNDESGDVLSIGQRVPDGAITTHALPAGSGYGGLAFIPVGPHAGDLLVSIYETGQIRRFSLLPNAEGFFDLTFESVAGELGSNAGIGDIEFMTGGPFAGSIAVARYREDYVSLHAFDESLAEVSPTTERLTQPMAGAWGLAFDSVSQEIFVAIYDSDAVQEDPALFRVPEPSAYSAAAAAVVALAALRARRRRG